jgi:hypothetical protein
LHDWKGSRDPEFVAFSPRLPAYAVSGEKTPRSQKSSALIIADKQGK